MVIVADESFLAFNKRYTQFFEGVQDLFEVRVKNDYSSPQTTTPRTMISPTWPQQLFPLGTLLQMSHLIVTQLGCPLDLAMFYVCPTLQKSALSSYLPYFQAAGVVQIISASPLGNILLTTQGPPDWQPAPKALCQVIKEVAKSIQTTHHLSIEHISLLYRGLISARQPPRCTPICTPLADWRAGPHAKADWRAGSHAKDDWHGQMMATLNRFGDLLDHLAESFGSWLPIRRALGDQ
ncbi:uncharacterized protein PGTG_19031 [Puccinia graminis f. sp. tritici CRL 75-36-700-3]|uniref:Uncharacterized protein n=1 Tax=Puccinia graminis f. sp. tritici (strain CRL 75-36-700-3 / race SCCL) TaxID=418459 RepID=E3L8M7_PUCGT|nr:uncharacterized protein PGTG_19031 [Puccinia graminis f. sp. tritici CRL 75-36-700-3]EFP92913.2 hypothetical protein PGTG_19031 [Puccinia graminis f. sp. tritici CRL 75-36-700-3]